MQVNGGCHCGAVAYQAEVDPADVALCNCTDCQTLSGSPFRWVVPAQSGSFRLLKGTLTTYIKTAESGRQREQGFCPHCGTPIYATSVGPEPKVHGLRVGSIVQRDLLLPRSQKWMRSAQSWTGSLAALPTTEK